MTKTAMGFAFILFILSLNSSVFGGDTKSYTDDDLDKYKHSTDAETYQYNKEFKDIREITERINKTIEFLDGLKESRIAELRQCERTIWRGIQEEKLCEESVIRKYNLVISEGERELERLKSLYSDMIKK